MTKYDTIQIGTHTPLPLLNMKAFIDVKNRFPEYSLPNRLPKKFRNDSTWDTLEHISERHKINWLKQYQYDGIYSKVRAWRTSGNNNFTNISKKLYSLKGSCYGLDWTDQDIINAAVDIANMNSFYDKWDESKDGNNAIRINGIRENHNGTYLNIVVHTDAKFTKDGVAIDNRNGYIGTSYPSDESALTFVNGYTKEQVLRYYINLYDNNPSLLQSFCGVRCP